MAKTEVLATEKLVRQASIKLESLILAQSERLRRA
jgi:hypothetical protein